MENQRLFRQGIIPASYMTSLKILVIGFLILVLLIPASMVQSLVRERQGRHDSVVSEINHKWGDKQRITGPYLQIPYKEYYSDKNKVKKSRLKYFHILPAELTVSGELEPQIRYRSIFESVLYGGTFQISGHFTLPDLSHKNLNFDQVQWENAILALGITDMRGIRSQVKIKFSGVSYLAEPGLPTQILADSGVQSAVRIAPQTGDLSFTLDLELDGSGEINFVPLGATTTVQLESEWSSPSFSGAFLPTRRTLTDQGFTAHWNVLQLNRSYPQFWGIGEEHSIEESVFGLRLMIPVDKYQKSIRMTKYALLFFVLTFASIFITEIICGKKVHIVQYFLIGLAIVLFYTLLLALSEHIRFGLAYLISASAITFLITAYSRSVLKSLRFAGMVFMVLVLLYTYFYTTLQMQDFALLTGSLGLFVVLSIFMFVTRHQEWSAEDPAISEE